jgi:hypothetical protein
MLTPEELQALYRAAGRQVGRPCSCSRLLPPMGRLEKGLGAAGGAELSVVRSRLQRLAPGNLYTTVLLLYIAYSISILVY